MLDVEDMQLKLCFRSLISSPTCAAQMKYSLFKKLITLKVR